MPSSITRLTTLDHERMHRLLRRVVTEGPSQDRWRDELVRLVRAHRQAESEVLDDDVVAAAGLDATSAVTELARTDHDLDDAVEALAGSPVPDPGLAALGHRLTALIAAHSSTLLERVLTPLELAVPRKEIRRLGGAYESRRDHHLQSQGDDEPPPRRLDVSRAELYELARRAGIEGRSAMSRRDLIAELLRRQPST